ncbi:hypothetical protein CO172_00445 [Candidatus Uhrbacteria bacterium CG_4_9_14_3_um_filter_36_7]|uniref:Uncharacterized protein n=1 Tax=Candidatus Uhrbacteria bacterium CG_4_9_14_3_um_filter_36_7 TaxID=1975033 RepID=A0A2M7XIB6_9BACT|nr:MAG: hypothetical protein CO172_00445 [Candidatus Uhrbacteria bacterium CG_4_9_14_3_um_filter_36_7]
MRIAGTDYRRQQELVERIRALAKTELVGNRLWQADEDQLNLFAEALQGLKERRLDRVELMSPGERDSRSKKRGRVFFLDSIKDNSMTVGALIRWLGVPAFMVRIKDVFIPRFNCKSQEMTAFELLQLTLDEVDLITAGDGVILDGYLTREELGLHLGMTPEEIMALKA